MAYDPDTSFKIPEPYYTALFEALPGSCVLLQNNAPLYTVLAATPEYLAQTGYKKEAIIGKGIFEMSPANPGDPTDTGASDLRNSLAYVQLYKEPHHLPVQRYDIAGANGSFSKRYWKASNKPVLSTNADVAFIIHTAEDITDQVMVKDMKEQMKGMEQAHNLFMQTPNPICILKGPELIVELANAPTLQLWGKSKDVIGLPLEQAIPEVKGQGFAEMINEVRQTGRAKQLYESPVTLVRNGKSDIVYINYTYQPFYGDDKTTPAGVLAIGLDVTERVLLKHELVEKTISLNESSEKLSSFLEAVPQIVWTNKPNGEIDFYNQQWFNYTGLNYQQSKEWGWQEVIHPDDLPSSMVTYRDKLQKGEEIVTENRFKRYDGQYRWQLSRATPIKDKKGNIKFWLGTCTDIHDRKLSEEELKESEERFRNLADDSPMFVFITNAGPTAPVRYWNKTWLQYTGQSREEAIGRAWDGIIHPDDVPVVMQHYRPAFQARKPYFIPAIRVMRHDGVYRWHAFKGNPRVSASGAFEGYVGVGFDIHEQKLAEEALKQSEVRLQQKVEERTADLEKQKAFIATILEASMDGIYALKAVRNADGVVTDFEYLFANNNIARLLNREVPDIIGTSMLALIPENRTNGFFDLFCTLLQTKETHRSETHFVAQGLDRWYDYVIVPIDKDTVVVSIEDISEKKQAALQMEEQRNLLDSILKNSSNGISVSKVFRDAKGTVVDALTILANEAAIKYIGLPEEVYLSKRATEIEPHIIGTPYYQSCIKTLETGEPFMMQYLMESTGRWLELTVSKLDDEHLIHVFTDVTPIKEAQLQLERTVEELRRSNANLEEFAYAASHDLKEPVRKVHFFSEKIKSTLHDRMTEGEKQSFDRMEFAARRMTSLIDDLLSYSQISIRPRTFEAVNMNGLIELVLQDLDLEIEDKKATVTVGNLFTIQGHHRQLQQAFQNLIANSLKYRKPGVAPKIKVSYSKVKGHETGLHLSVEEGQKSFYCITVQDNGIGFEQQDAERIFNVFTRLHGNTEYRGTGIGLSIVRKMVENHHGYIWAESTPGEGATFNVLLPAE